jgi:predicted flap endonuclease-1-like 5' DNA nuclease
MASIEEIEGVGPAMGKKLRAAGIRTCESLLKNGGTKAGRTKIAADSGIDAKRILAWVNYSDLMRIKGVGSEYSQLLEVAGVDTVKELKMRRPDNLAAKMLEVNAKKKLVRRPPSEKEVTRWVAQAKKLKPAVSH